MVINYTFAAVGEVATPEPGKVYVDVGNAFCPGVLDHHHPDAPDACTAMLVLNHPEYIVSQIVGGKLTIIPHAYPDLDAVTGAYFARMHAKSESVEKYHHDWAEYVCNVDRGFTTLDPSKSVTPYSLFMMRMHLLRSKLSEDTSAASLLMLKAGFDFLEALFGWLRAGGDIRQADELGLLPVFAPEVEELNADHQKYKRDTTRADTFSCLLPEISGSGCKEVPGLWVEKPEAALFKSWARGDHEHSNDPDGFVFLAIQVADNRFILSVDPGSDVYLKGLGDLIEQAETEKRKQLGMERVGENRPGYDSPDPWYDGRSPLHNYTIIDSPRTGTVLEGSAIRKIFSSWVKEN